MAKGRKAKQRIAFVTLLLVLSLAGTGCGDNGRQAKEPVQTEGSEAGVMSYGYFYEKEGIVVSSGERFLYSDWEPVEFDYICRDVTCSHLNESCSARAIQDEKGLLKDFSLVYQNRLIILHSYFQLTVNEISEKARDWNYVYQTDVYEAALDGSNRRKMAAFLGSIGSPTMSHAAVLADGKLYFGGPTEELIKMEYDAQGQLLSYEMRLDNAVYCLDLNDYTLESHTVLEDEVITQEGYQYQFYEYDGMIYGIISNFQGDNAIWYRINPETGECEEILRFDSNVAWFGGAIENKVYYIYENSQKTLHARELAAGAEDKEIITVTAEGMSAMPFVFDGLLLNVTDYCVEGEDHMVEYTVLDPDGNVLDTIRYDDYIIFADMVGDKIIYFKGYPDWEIWWADKKDFSELVEKGVKIGPLNGSMLDKISTSAVQ